MRLPEWLLTAAALVGLAVLIAGGAAVVARLRRDARGEAEPEEDPLAPIRAAYRAGELDEAEYRRACEARGRPDDPLREATRRGPPRGR